MAERLTHMELPEKVIIVLNIENIGFVLKEVVIKKPMVIRRMGL